MVGSSGTEPVDGQVGVSEGVSIGVKDDDDRPILPPRSGLQNVGPTRDTLPRTVSIAVGESGNMVKRSSMNESRNSSAMSEGSRNGGMMGKESRAGE